MPNAKQPHTHTHTSAHPPIPWAGYPVDALRLELFCLELLAVGLSPQLVLQLVLELVLQRVLQLILQLVLS